MSPPVCLALWMWAWTTCDITEMISLPPMIKPMGFCRCNYGSNQLTGFAFELMKREIFLVERSKSSELLKEVEDPQGGSLVCLKGAKPWWVLHIQGKEFLPTSMWGWMRSLSITTDRRHVWCPVRTPQAMPWESQDSRQITFHSINIWWCIFQE